MPGKQGLMLNQLGIEGLTSEKQTQTIVFQKDVGNPSPKSYLHYSRTGQQVLL